VNFGPNILALLKALKKHYKPPKVCGPKLKNKKVTGGRILTIIPIFLEIGELWSTYFDVVGKL